MSRFYEGDGDNPVGFMWNANIERICNGKRGQKILRELIDALLALPQRRLIANRMASAEGEVCAVACYARHKGVPLPDNATEENSEPYETTDLGERAGLGFMLAWELGALNDMELYELTQRRRQVKLDVPVQEDRPWRGDGRPSYTTYVSVYNGPLVGYSPEERWQGVYKWAASRVRWNLPAFVVIGGSE